MVLIIAGNYMGYANGRNVQIFEPVIIALSDPSYSIFIMLGLLLTLLDAPFINARTPYLVTRGSRKSWYSGTLFYMYTQIIVYYALIFAATVATGILANVSAQQLERDGIPAGDTASDGCAGNMGP